MASQREPLFIPDGKGRAAVALTFDFDAESVWLAEDPANADRPCVLSAGTYGATRGLPLLLEVLRRYEVQGTFFVVGTVAEEYPQQIDDIVAGGHELAVHGYTHTSPEQLAQDQLAVELTRTREILRTHGAHVDGYRSPSANFRRDLIPLLHDLGFRYSSNYADDVFPYRHGGTSLVEVPTSYILDDAAHWMFSSSMWLRKMATNLEVQEIWKSEFEGICSIGGVFVPVMHPQVIGRPGRLDVLEHMLTQIRQRGNVFVGTCIDIVNMVDSCDRSNV